MRDLTEAIAAIDSVNEQDPNCFGSEPLALVQGRLASSWLAHLSDDPTQELQLAVRAHHLRRWEIVRSEYEEGRSGYLRWRRDNKAHQAASVAAVLEPLGFTTAVITRVQDLLLRKGLGADPETQLLEDSACLVFVETQFEQLNDRLDHERMVNAVYKTLKKMSVPAIALASTQSLSEPAQLVMADAVAVLEAKVK